MYWHCEFCDSYFENKQLLDEHTIVLHPFQVEADIPCRSEFVKEMLKKIKSSETKSNKVCCCACKRMTEESNATLFECPEDLYLNCEICGALLLRKAMVYHLAEHCKSFKCAKCSIAFESESAVMEHHRAHWLKKEISCLLCNECTVHVAGLTVIKYHKHFDIEEFLHCCLCKKEFIAASRCPLILHLKSHVNKMVKEVNNFVSHLEEKNYLCFLCSGRFKNEKELIEYLSDNRTGSYLCEICGVMYDRNKMHHRHQHTGERPYLCDVCGLTFATSSCLRSHLKVHSDETPHECTVCKKKFKWLCERDQHARIHTGDKPHSCHFCDKAFISKERLKRHHLVHSDNRCYPCQFCDKSFKNSYTLRVHLRSHTREKPFTCERCGMTFAHKVSLVKYHSCPKAKPKDLHCNDERNFKLKICSVVLNRLGEEH